MTTDQFAFWLQGFIEIENPTKLDEKQTQIIKDHLKLVFDKKTPDRHNDFNPEHVICCNNVKGSPTSTVLC